MQLHTQASAGLPSCPGLVAPTTAVTAVSAAIAITAVSANAEQDEEHNGGHRQKEAEGGKGGEAKPGGILVGAGYVEGDYVDECPEQQEEPQTPKGLFVVADPKHYRYCPEGDRQQGGNGRDDPVSVGEEL